MPELGAKSIDEVVNEVQALAAVASQPQVRSVAAVLGRCTIELAQSVNQLSGTVFVAKQQLTERLDQLNTQLERSREEMAAATREAGKYTAALVFWTKVLVGVTAIYTLITGGLLFVALKSRS
jgi:outer membrane murein-binding lipoprotein Lpp